MKSWYLSKVKIYLTVYSFGHRQTSNSVEYLVLYPSLIELTSDHMLYVEGKGAVPASMVQVGDSLFGGVTVSKIRTIHRRGMYAPFTVSGGLVVNGVLASSYKDNSHVLMIGSVSTGVPFQWLAHTAQLSHRIWCYHLGSCATERYTLAGVSVWVDFPLGVSIWILKKGTVLNLLLTIPVLVLTFGFLSICEILITHAVAAAMLVAALCMMTGAIPRCMQSLVRGKAPGKMHD
jgi:hypothetical protein